MHEHSPHPDFRKRARNRLRIAAGLTFLLCAGEFVGGFLSNSLSLVSDAGHMLADLFALSLSLLSIAWATKPAGTQKTYGYYRLEILASLINASLLLFMAFQIFWEVSKRFSHPRPITVEVMLPVAIAGLIVNLISVYLLRNEGGHLVTRSALYHVIADSLSSVGVITAGVVVHFTGAAFLDTAVGLLIGCMILASAYRLLRESVDILLEASPATIPLERVRQVILSVEGVRDVHDLHVWTISSGFHSATAHLTVPDMRVTESGLIVATIERRLREEFAITHTTLQLSAETSPARIQTLPK